MIVYLAGPIRGHSYNDANNWRERVRDSLPNGVKVLSPMRDKEFLRRKRKIRDSYPDHPLATDHAITTRDRADVMRCDVVLMNLLGAGEVSLGTMAELGWADAWRKPVVLVMEARGNPHDHPFLRSIAGFVTDNLDEAIEMVISILDVK